MPSSLLPLILSLAPATTAAPASAQEPAPLDSEIVGVTVYGGSASVQRRAELPAGGGLRVLRGLPYALDPDSVRLRCTGAEVVSVEVRERLQTNVPDARVAEARERVRALERDVQRLQDELAVVLAMERHVQALLAAEEDAHRDDVRAGRADTDAWDANFTYLRDKLAALKREVREQGWRIEDAQRLLGDAQVELGRHQDKGGVRLRDVVLDVVDTSGGPATLELEYVVGNAGWTPYYDLRADERLAKVELAYRAKVWQRSGEDWRDVPVALSTARPQRGAQGPEPRPQWLSLHDPRTAAGADKARSGRRSLGYAADEAAPAETPVPAAATFAAVVQQGLSVRFALPRRETIESRDDPTTVLIGRSDLAIEPEHYCVPALDTTVWLRALARNTSPWVMLPGRAAVYFGADFIGHAQIETVQVDQELTLHLGPDPGIQVQRTQVKDRVDKPGIFGSKQTLEQAWHVEVANNAAFSPRGDGAVDVIVQEVLPRARDDRIEVEIERSEPSLRDDARWAKERSEKGVLTWIVRVPRGAKQLIRLETAITYPDGLGLVR